MFKVFYQGDELDLTKRNKTLAKIVGIDNPNEFKDIRKAAKKSEVHLDVDPYASDISGVNTLVWATDYDTLAEDIRNKVSDI
jgi:antitoxin (DNA-binding transcriptional repressor) of toxin-antitoxin stability system